MFFKYFGILCSDENKEVSQDDLFVLVTKRMISYKLHFLKKINISLLKDLEYSEVEVRGFLIQNGSHEKVLLVRSLRAVPQVNYKSLFNSNHDYQNMNKYSEVIYV